VNERDGILGSNNLESFTLIAGLAAVTTRVNLCATAASPVMPPAIVARMAFSEACRMA
jgi:alkanesulfonate monooxygenase SsuD/methylene tetrahydromethanopterin reductase-like flavin-dependent oxidoreductase (luciferase family)